ncbi:XRE family transcriptional regulator [Paenochrobactrum sp. BZR 588]|uniref:XRE family transcriptional regulator n=1 Tax=unclassified Paenochrobactrum TaxID=2639760 RepID=UPI003853CFE8
MDKSPSNRIREIRDQQGLTIEELAERADISVSYMSRLENGQRNLSLKNMNVIAHALGVSAQDLLLETENRNNVVRVMGKIGAGAEISPEEEQIPPEGLYEIETPFPLPDDAIAFEVVGDSMWPRYDPGDIIICYKQGVSPAEVIGWEAAVKTSDEKRYLKRILKGGTSNHYDLESHNAPPIRNVGIVWAAAVQSVIRMGQWTRLPASYRQHQLYKMK